MASPLADLEELVLKCRDDQSKKYIKEAVACYKVEAFRSSIVSTWIAILFDLIDKLKELSNAGDKEASLQLSIYEKAIQNHDISQSLRFEKDLLGIAQSKLDLISKVELIDLERIQLDRNRCAHPSMNVDGEIFNPTAELVRTHIRSAVEYLLQYPPAQGRYALEKLLKDINSQYFPSEKANIEIALSKSPLARPRESLVSSLVVVLLKDLTAGNVDYKERRKKVSVLKVVKSLHGDQFDRAMERKFSSLVRELSDDSLMNAVHVLIEMPEIWFFLDGDISQRIKIYVKNLPADEVSYLEELLTMDAVRLEAQFRVKRMTREELGSLFLFGDVPAEILDRIVHLYCASSSLDEISNFSDVVLFYAPDLSKSQIKKLISDCAKKEVMMVSTKHDRVLAELKPYYENDSEFDDLSGDIPF